MPDWTAPFHRPHMTTAEFRKMKEKYVEEHGYYMSVPGLWDILHIGMETKMTPEEEKLWKAREYNKIEPWRIADIKKMKQKRKDKFLSMLASPTPHIVNNAGSIMTSIDDAQDALATLGFIGTAVIAAAPRALAKVLSGPVGWAMTAAEILNAVQHLGLQRLGPKKAKRIKDAATQDNPKSKRIKIKNALKTKKLWPRQGVIVEALQVADNVFGYGICLGPIVGFAIETVTGPYRRITGAPVKVKLPWESMTELTRKAQKQSRSQLAYVGAGLQTDRDEVMTMAFANFHSNQELLTMASDVDVDDHIDDVGSVEILAPVPENVLTREVISEEGINIDDVVGWPHSGKKWLPISDIGPEYGTVSSGFAKDFMRQHNNDWYGYAFGSLSTQSTLHTFATAEGADMIEYDYSVASKWSHQMLDQGQVLNPDQPRSKFTLMVREIQRMDKEDEQPTFRNTQKFCAENNILLESFL